jgi:hypothetical protein
MAPGPTKGTVIESDDLDGNGIVRPTTAAP